MIDPQNNWSEMHAIFIDKIYSYFLNNLQSLKKLFKNRTNKLVIKFCKQKIDN